MKQNQNGMGRMLGHIVVLDDSRFVLAHTRSMLEQQGYRVSAFCHPNELESVNIDDAVLLLVDVNIGRLSGDQLLAGLRERVRKAKVLLMSTIPENELRARAAQAGADGYIQKGPKFIADIERQLGSLTRATVTARPGRG